MKPANQKPNRLDRLELIMADQEALGMNEESEKTPKPKATANVSGERERNRAQAKHLLHYLTDEIGAMDGSPAMSNRQAAIRKPESGTLR